MFVSDCLSRLVLELQESDYKADISDEILEEVVIATAASNDLILLELYQQHQKEHHCSAERLHIISDWPLSQCTKCVNNCFQCVSLKKVRKQSQILGTIPEGKAKNHTWSIDFTYGDNVRLCARKSEGGGAIAAV